MLLTAGEVVTQPPHHVFLKWFSRHQLVRSLKQLSLFAHLGKCLTKCNRCAAHFPMQQPVAVTSLQLSLQEPTASVLYVFLASFHIFTCYLVSFYSSYFNCHSYLSVIWHSRMTDRYELSPPSIYPAGLKGTKMLVILMEGVPIRVVAFAIIWTLWAHVGYTWVVLLFIFILSCLSRGQLTRIRVAKMTDSSREGVPFKLFGICN